MKMESLVENARKFERCSKYDEFGKPKILVVGVGGAGNNSINRLQEMGVKGATTLAINTDQVHLSITNAAKKILIGKSLTKGLGAGGYPVVGEQCAEIARDVLKENLKGADLVFILGGMGGGTGTGASPVVAEIAKKEGAIVVGIVSIPFAVERRRNAQALEGIDKLRRRADSVVVLENDRLLKFAPRLPLLQAFSVMDQLVSEVVKGITETITQPSLVNLDYADVKTIMTNGGLSMMLYGEADADPDTVVKNMLNYPLLDVDYKGANGALVHITAGPEFSLADMNRVTEGITKELDPNANVIWGARVDESCNGRIKVMSIMTGVHSPNIFSPDSVLDNVAPSTHPAGQQIPSDVFAPHPTPAFMGFGAKPKGFLR